MNNIINLLKMQFHSLFAQNKTILIMLVLALVYPFIMPEMIVWGSGIFLLGLTNISLSREKQSKVDSLIKTLPVSNREYVISRFLYCIISTCITLVMMSGLAVILGESVKVIIISTLIIGVCMTSVLMPVVVIFGPEKAKIAIVFLTLIPLFLAMELSKNIGAISLPNISTMMMILLGALVGILLIYVSYIITLNIYRRMEF